MTSSAFDVHLHAAWRLTRAAGLVSLVGACLLACPAALPSGSTGNAKAAASAATPGTERSDGAPHVEGGTPEAARELAAKLADEATRSATVLSLEPSSADYVAVYGERFGPALEAHFAPMWARREIVPSPWGPDQTQVILRRATTQDFLAWQNEAKQFPRGYRRMAGFMQPDQVFYQFRFVKAGDAAGSNWDGLVWVGGAWKLFPKPWLAAPEGSPFFVEPSP